MIKKNDKVIVRDNSYSLAIKEEGVVFKHAIPGKFIFDDSPVFKVIYTGDVPLPSYNTTSERKAGIPRKKNDTIIENIATQENFIIRREFLIKINTPEYEKYLSHREGRIKAYKKNKDMLTLEGGML